MGPLHRALLAGAVADNPQIALTEDEQDADAGHGETRVGKPNPMSCGDVRHAARASTDSEGKRRGNGRARTETRADLVDVR